MKNYINGKWENTTGTSQITVVNPGSEEELIRFTTASPQDVDAAVAAAQQALESWSLTSPEERANWLNKIADAIDAAKNTLIELSHRNNGKSSEQAQVDVDNSIKCYRYYANLVKSFAFSQVTECDGGIELTHQQNPVGVVALITPWNFPLITSAWKIAPALAAGCTLIFKPSELVPLPEYAFTQLLDQIQFPQGVFNLILGDAVAAQHLVTHPEVNKVSFTGSTEVGIHVMQAAARSVKRVTLELGGKSPILILEDADLDEAVDKALGGMFYNSGQMCSATSRLLVHQSIAERFYQKFKAAVESIILGSDLTGPFAMGPMTTQKQFQKVHEYLSIAKDEKLQTLIDFEQIAVPEKGFFIQPHVFVNVPTDSRLWKEEIFGPVICCRSFETEEEAIRLANDSEFGLAATIITGSLEHGKKIAKRLRSGHIWINSHQMIQPSSLWGGFKKSGIGRELGQSGMQSYLEENVITL
ncbi:Aldehyde dehydrogenase [Acinetobacter sp. neg1]|uniref:aldehyde dehydrogenase family protein n=1 Tax=Acinetobacter TaxID=469 RepID=UPI000541E728|nr:MULTISPECIES: aldehyde dehydrogenase family protein [Acinetobacter]KHF78819.1 Aldehyde dehydrogenase [Acinetobacter sp. neg1]MBJ8483698.1 aldehyde dehydrogenase family protein [Acinetobacter vivianii]